MVAWAFYNYVRFKKQNKKTKKIHPFGFVLGARLLFNIKKITCVII